MVCDMNQGVLLQHISFESFRLKWSCTRLESQHTVPTSNQQDVKTNVVKRLSICVVFHVHMQRLLFTNTQRRSKHHNTELLFLKSNNEYCKCGWQTCKVPLKGEGCRRRWTTTTKTRTRLQRQEEREEEEQEQEERQQEQDITRLQEQEEEEE